jgi:alpha-N-arabinofuranosidase
VWPKNDDYHWTEILMRRPGIIWTVSPSITIRALQQRGKQDGAGAGRPSTRRGDWFLILRNAHRTEARESPFRRHGPVRPEKRVALVVDNWGTWFDVEPERIRLSVSADTMRDALGRV